MQDYEFDIFISYRRQRFSDQWLVENFLPIFEFHLGEEIAGLCKREARIFFDVVEVSPDIRTGLERAGGIEPGSAWRSELKKAMTRSRCMVGVWSPRYFLSSWCLTEWQSFARRPGAPMVPMSVYDGENFPPEARGINWIDMSKYVIAGRALIDGKRSESFQDCVKLLAQKAAKAAKEAPAFQLWPIVEDAVDSPPSPHHIRLPSFADGS